MFRRRRADPADELRRRLSESREAEAQPEPEPVPKAAPRPAPESAPQPAPEPDESELERLRRGVHARARALSDEMRGSKDGA